MVLRLGDVTVVILLGGLLPWGTDLADFLGGHSSDRYHKKQLNKERVMFLFILLGILLQGMVPFSQVLIDGQDQLLP